MAKIATNISSNQLDLFLELFSKQHFNVREKIASILPAYNDLLNMHALSFEEFALLPLAKQQGLAIEDPLFSYEKVLPVCPQGCTNTSVKKQADNIYVCSSCKTKFSANHDSISSGSKCSSVIWLKVLRCILDSYTVERTCEYCDISKTTYYKIRNKLFYAMSLLMDEIKLYGNIQMDNTFVHVSYKGNSLKDHDYPEGSPFDTIDFVPREARSRGGARKISDRAINDICILCAADDHGHVITRFVGIGAANANLLTQALSKDRFLLTVPERDPSSFYKGREQSPNTTKAGTPSLLISDKEKAIERFARIYGIPHESRIFRKNGVQMRYSEDIHTIQVINNLHGRLKEFLRKNHHVSSKYLPGYLVLFEFVINTGATQDAIAELFSVLARPGLGKSVSFYENLFTVPNYLLQWLKDDNPLRHFSYNELRAYYLYDQKKRSCASEAMTVEEIAEACGTTPATVRRRYKNLESAGYGDLIRSYFQQREREPGKAPKQPRQAVIYSPEVLAMYDEWAENHKKPRSERLSREAFAEIMNKKYQTGFTVVQLARYFHEISKKGLRPPLPPFNSDPGIKTITQAQQEHLMLYLEHQKNQQACRREGLPPPSMEASAKILASQYKLTLQQMTHRIHHGSTIFKKVQAGIIIIPNNSVIVISE